MKYFSLDGLFDDATLQLIIDNRYRPDFHQWCKTTVVEPNMERINETIGQENDASYIAYAIEYLVSQLRG
jgi:hypothetical protein